MIADHANEVINDHALNYKNTPLFLYLPFQNVHGPLEVPDEYRDLYHNEENAQQRTYHGKYNGKQNI